MKNPTSKLISNWLQPSLKTWRIANNSNVWAHCASVGFFGFLSIFPVMAVFVLLYGLAFSPAEMQEQISILRPFIPDTVYEVLNSRLSALVSNTTSALTFSLVLSTLLALYAGSKGVKSLIILINLAFHITQERSFIQGNILAVGLTFGAVVILIIAVSSIAIIPVGAAYFPFPQIAKTIALWSRWPILAGIIFLSFLSLYRLAPNRDAVALKKLVPGAALATILWIVLSVEKQWIVGASTNREIIFPRTGITHSPKCYACNFIFVFQKKLEEIKVTIFPGSFGFRSNSVFKWINFFVISSHIGYVCSSVSLWCWQRT